MRNGDLFVIFFFLLIGIVVGFFLCHKFYIDPLKKKLEKPVVSIDTITLPPITKTDTLRIVETKFKYKYKTKHVVKHDTVYIENKVYTGKKNLSKPFSFDIKLDGEFEDKLLVCFDVNSEVIAEFDDDKEQISLKNKLTCIYDNKKSKIKIHPRIKFVNKKTALRPYFWLGGVYNEEKELNLLTGLSISLNERILVTAGYSSDKSCIFGLGASLW